ncbi:MAG: heavy metal-binding domain-containing protein [Bryobacteraceae bacterium]
MNSRREFLAGLLVARTALKAQLAPTREEQGPPEPLDWTCPMDPDVHMARPGKCPRCGMRLVLKIPERVEYGLEVETQPPVLKPGGQASITLRVVAPDGTPVSHFDLVHEKLIHLFIVSENLEFFEHIHPALENDKAFHIRTRLDNSGMYRLLADYYPTGSVPQLSLSTLYVDGPASPPHLKASLAPSQSTNIKATLRMEPEQPMAGLETRLFFDIDPYEGLERYLGVWGHMLVASEDLVDLIHTHPFLAGGPTIQFNVIFPRAGLHRIWTQFQRHGVVNTVVFTIDVRDV